MICIIYLVFFTVYFYHLFDSFQAFEIFYFVVKKTTVCFTRLFDSLT
jgi:hypothetical protein